MNQIERERLFLNRDQWIAHTDRLRACHMPDEFEGHSSPRTAIRRSMYDRPTAEVIRRNYTFEKRSWRFEDLFRRNSDTSYEKRSTQITEAIAAYRAAPSAKLANQIELAVNQISVSAKAAKRSAELIQEAKAVLAERFVAHDFEGDNVTAELYRDIEFGEPHLFVNLQAGRYTGFENLKQQKFNDQISSALLSCSTDEFAGDLFLFQDARYLGRYLKLETTASVTTGLLALDSFMNDRTSSLLVYRRNQMEIVQSVSDFVPANTLAPIIDAQAHLSARGNPIFTWDLYPDGKAGHPNSPWMTYLYIRIPITVDPPHWVWDYDAEIRFWIYPFVDESGNVNFQVDYYGAWVEGGLISGKILSTLMEKIPDSLGELDGVLTSAAGAANFKAPFSEVYMLPGKNADKGNTDEDVTLVLIPGEPLPPSPIQ